MHGPIRIAAIVAALAVWGCGGSPSPTAPSSAPSLPVGFALVGDPEAPGGASWTYRATDRGVTYDLQGIILKPRGQGPFPAVVISHGFNSSASGYPARVAAQMLTWGLVCIAANYTHAGGVPVGSPGSGGDIGASQANVLRARKLVDLLSALGFVDTRRVAAHGHSLGAFVTTAVLAGYPGLFRVASHTAGGVLPIATPFGVPTDTDASAIVTPYQLHHGESDDVVPLSVEQRLNAVLQSRGVDHELFVYPRASHDDVALDATMLIRVRGWYAAHGMF